MNEIIINCDDITKVYGKKENAVTALRGIDLQIYKGELFMLVGPSGCGKTTLISIIAGILDPSAGTCEVLSKDVGKARQSELVNFRAKNIGFVFQAFNLLPALTAAENVAVPLLINGFSLKHSVDKAAILLDKVGLKGREKALPSQLSGGQQQRVAIARALIHEPKIIVCDEPTSSLDHVSGQKIMELMQELCREKGNTMIIVTHDNRIFKYADRIGKMDDGRIVSIES